MDTEFTIQSYVSTQLKKLGILHHGDQNAGQRTRNAGGRAKASGMRKGWPDMCVVYKNTIHWIEFKSARGYLSQDQRDVHRLLKNNRQNVYVVQEDTKEKAWAVTKKILGL